jgi:16S rRNA (adenine1518-N6/adenine1519-N6)-dimethyltransferase
MVERIEFRNWNGFVSPRLSQVFLRDPVWIDRVTSRVPEAPFGVEWASGEGALTESLVDRWTRGLAIELDQELCVSLSDRLDTDGWQVIRTDLLNYPLPSKRERYPLVGNLPYHLTGPALFSVLKRADRLSQFQGLVQREVADRLRAEPGDSDYRGISILFQLRGRLEVPFELPPDAFNPQPDVSSAWVEFYPDPSVGPIGDRPDLTDMMFQMPRKTLLNNLEAGGESKDDWRDWMTEKDWDPRRRPHSITPSEFEEMYQRWTKD